MIVVESFVKCAQGNHSIPVCSNWTRQGCFGRHPLETPEHTQADTAGFLFSVLTPQNKCSMCRETARGILSILSNGGWVSEDLYLTVGLVTELIN